MKQEHMIARQPAICPGREVWVPSFEAFISQDTMHVWSWSSEEAFRELKRQTVPNGEELLHWQSWAVKPTLKELNWYKGAEVLGMDAHWLL